MKTVEEESFGEKVNLTTGKNSYIIDQSVMEKNNQVRTSSKELEITDEGEEGVHL